MDAIASTIGNMVVSQVAATDTTKLRTQQAIDGVTGQILPGGLGGVGSGFVAPETSYSSSAALFGVYGGLVDSSQTPYSGASTLYGPGMGLSDLATARTPLSAEPFRAQFDGPMPGVVVAGPGAGEAPRDAFVRGVQGGYAGLLDPSPNAAYAGKLVGDAAQSFKQFGYQMIGAQSADEARAAWNSGNYGLAAAKELQAFGEAGLAVMGMSSAAGPVTRVLGAAGEYAESKVASLGEPYGLGTRLSVVPEGPNALGAPVPRINVADEFSFKANKNGSVTLQYGDPEGVHGLIVNVDRQGVLGFDIRSPAGGSSMSAASGTDMFASAMQRLDREGVSVSAIRGIWIEGTDSVNAAQYRLNLNSVTSPQQAAANTWTGRLAARYGYTNVGVPNTAYSTTTVIFGR